MTVNFTRGLSNWTQGSASVANGSRTVTFSGANLIANDPSNPAVQIYVAGEGDKFIVDGVGVATIASVDSASQVTLDAPWSAATQTAVAYKIRRYNEVKTGEVAKYIQAAQTTGQDTNPLVSLTVDDSVARGKLRETGGNIEVAVGPTGTADGSLKAALRADPATGYASFPNGYKHNNPGFRNRLINGNFDIWQRGTSFTIANGASAYTADRRLIANYTGVTITVTQVAAPSGFFGRYALNIQATGVPANGYVIISRRMEMRDIADLDSKACVFAFDANGTTSAGTVVGYSRFACNSAIDNSSWSVLSGASSFTFPVGSGRVVSAFSAANTAGIKYGADLQTVIEQHSATGNWNISIGAEQFEADPSGAGKANDFEFRPLPVELAMCKRYYQRVPLQGVLGQAIASNIIFCSLKFEEMRATPTATLLKTSVSGATYDLSVGWNFVTASGLSITNYGAQPKSASFQWSGFSGLTVGGLAAGNGLGDLVELSAEL